MHSTAMPGRLQHIVLVDLTDDSEIAAMKADSDRMLPTLPMVKGYICGTAVDIGRGNVSKDYDIGMFKCFFTEMARSRKNNRNLSRNFC